jgi:hypothetical protein
MAEIFGIPKLKTLTVTANNCQAFCSVQPHSDSEFRKTGPTKEYPRCTIPLLARHTHTHTSRVYDPYSILDDPTMATSASIKQLPFTRYQSLRDFVAMNFTHPQPSQSFVAWNWHRPGRTQYISQIHTVTPQVLGLHLALALHEPKHHLFIYENGTYVMH